MSMATQSAVSTLSDPGLLRSQGLIGGKWVQAYDGKTIQVNNPATGEVITNVPCMGRKETTDAISSASEAFKTWSKLTANERSKCLRKWYDLLIAHKEVLGKLITLEQGKPLKEAIGEVTYGANFIDFYAEEAKRIYGDIIPATLTDRRLFVIKQPVGVVGAITPWNFLLAMITRKVGPALACGCTVVIKPSELTPLTALAAVELSIQAGIPPGAVNVVMGNASEIGDTLLESSQVRKITFTGSMAVGKKLMAGAAQTVKKVHNGCRIPRMESGADMFRGQDCYAYNHNLSVPPPATEMAHATTVAASMLLSGSTMSNNREPALSANSLFFSSSATSLFLSVSAPSNCTPVGLLKL
ncbi:succinate-semialdehyde dehydrogenase, mitochondrial-like isoform X1 [Papaver somniferum]|nr:succinate-semialdehyde dehydrogenase, mitochondrial-like isoform X1 [Papaver somniferum]XP_026405893.1 succinate-semialdehyde dehydrogenase, mitochondrial-like isoform X1 [Papaver somniferum]